MFRALLVISFCIVPTLSHAQVMLSEIAWMGTDTDANNEWIELYNLSNTSTDVTGYTVTLNDASFITLAGSIPSHGIVVLERTDDTTLPDTAFQIYTGALPNTGATLVLRDLGGTVTDSVDGGTDWDDIGGTNTVPKMTPQRTRTGTWVTGIPTPGADNVQANDPATEDEDDEEEENNDDEDDDSSSSSNTKSSGGGTKKKSVTEAEDSVFRIAINAPRTVYVNQAVSFTALPSGIGEVLKNSLIYTWNFGDTYTGHGREAQHTFSYPGDYVVVTEGAFAKQSAMTRHEITVLPVSVVLMRSDAGDIMLMNNSKNEIDLGGYTMIGNSSFVFPKFTILKPGASLTIARDRVRATLQTRVALHDALGTTLATESPGAGGNGESTSVASKPTPQRIASSESVTQGGKGVTATSLQEAPVSEVMKNVPIVQTEEPIVIAIGEQGNATQEDTPGFFKKAFGKIFGFFGLTKN